MKTVACLIKNKTIRTMAFIDQMALELKCGRKLLAGFLFIAANSTISEWSDQRRIKEMQRDAVDMLIV